MILKFITLGESRLKRTLMILRITGGWKCTERALRPVPEPYHNPGTLSLIINFLLRTLVNCSSNIKKKKAEEPERQSPFLFQKKYR